MIFFVSFRWHCETCCLKIWKLENNSDDAHWNVWTNIKTLYAQNNIFKKRVPNMRFWIIYILIQISFLGTALGRFIQCFFLIFHRRSIIVADIFAQPMALSQLLILSWAFSYSPTKLQNYSLVSLIIVNLWLTNLKYQQLKTTTK